MDIRDIKEEIEGIVPRLANRHEVLHVFKLDSIFENKIILKFYNSLLEIRYDNETDSLLSNSEGFNTWSRKDHCFIGDLMEFMEIKLKINGFRMFDHENL